MGDKPELRIFIAHAKGDSEETLIEMRDAITLALRRAFPSREPKVTLGRDDYNRNFTAAGSWDTWAREVATAIHPTTREPRYHGIVVPADRVGAATQAIVGQALGMAKPVLLFLDGRLTQAKSVVKLPGRDFRTGWLIS